MIPIYIGNAPDGRDKRAVDVLTHSILSNTEHEVDIQMLNQPDTGGTGFSLARWSIPDVMLFRGYAIYLDSDMLVLGDIHELWMLREEGRWVTSDSYPKGSSAVSVIDCAVELPHYPTDKKPLNYDRFLVNRGIMVPTIPSEWNMRNAYDRDTKLIHYTKRAAQPWLVDGDREIDKIWYEYEEMM